MAPTDAIETFWKRNSKKKIKIVISTREKRQKRKQQKNSRRNRNPGACGWAGRGARTTPFNTPEPEKEISTLKSMGKKKKTKKGKKEKRNEGGKKSKWKADHLHVPLGCVGTKRRKTTCCQSCRASRSSGNLLVKINDKASPTRDFSHIHYRLTKETNDVNEYQDIYHFNCKGHVLDRVFNHQVKQMFLLIKTHYWGDILSCF